jgi:hypothetical protein
MNTSLSKYIILIKAHLSRDGKKGDGSIFLRRPALPSFRQDNAQEFGVRVPPHLRIAIHVRANGTLAFLALSPGRIHRTLGKIEPSPFLILGGLTSKVQDI